MGGDGGTKAVNRAYLRGAGSASTTGDHPNNNNNNNNIHGSDKHIAAEEASRAMHYCYISDQPLPFHDNNHNVNDSVGVTTPQLLSTSKIVTCRYGRLYNKEAAIEALLQRKQLSKSSKSAVAASTTSDTTTIATNGRLGSHIRGLKDLFPVRFQTIMIDDDTTTGTGSSHTHVVVPVCPITARELNGRIVAYALVPGHVDTTVNVVSEYALKQLSEHDVLTEYGATKKIRLLAPTSLYASIDEEYKKEAAASTSSSNKKRKLKHDKMQHPDITNKR